MKKKISTLSADDTDEEKKNDVVDLVLKTEHLALDERAQEQEIEIDLTKEAATLLANPQNYYSHYALNFVVDVAVANNLQVRFIRLGEDQNLEKNLQQFKDGDQIRVIMPLRLTEREHFTGLYIEKMDEMYRVVYIDPVGSGAKSEIPGNIKNTLNQILGISEDQIISTTNKIQHSVVQHQGKYLTNVHCGPFTGFILSGLALGYIRAKGDKLELRTDQDWQDIPDLSESQSKSFGEELRRHDLSLLTGGEAIFPNMLLKECLESKFEHDLESITTKMTSLPKAVATADEKECYLLIRSDSGMSQYSDLVEEMVGIDEKIEKLKSNNKKLGQRASARATKNKITPEEKYGVEGDDSSDEELEQKIYQRPLNAGYYSSLDTRVKEAKLLKHNIVPIKTTDKEIIEGVITKVEKIEDFLTPKKKISHTKKIKEKVNQTLATLEDSPAKKAVQDAYEECKLKDTTDLRALAIKKFLGGSETEALPNIQANPDIVPLLDLKWSLIFQDLGMRLLISNPVRELYFSNKEKFGKFNNLPTDEIIRKCLENTVRKTLEKHQGLIPSILEHESYITLVNKVLEDKRKVFSLLNSNNSLYTSLDELLKVMNEQVAAAHQQHFSSAILEVGGRRVESIISNLQKISGFITLSKKTVSTATNIKNEVLAQLKKTTTFNHLYIEAVKEAYAKLGGNKKISDLTTLAKEKLAKKQIEIKKEEELDYGLDLMPNLQNEIIKLKDILLRPVLPDSTSFSSKDITPDGEYFGSETLFCYLRLIHCSAKRSIKNAKLMKDFDGAVFARGWQFDAEKKLSVTETQSLSSSHSITSMVLYPHQSSYSYLLTKLEDFQKKANVTSDDIINGMKSILKNGKLPEKLSISPPFERFLTTLTYHLFGTEVERHPAAAIHNVMALDLVKIKGFSWAFKHLPMAIEDATPVARGVQTTLHKNYLIPYYYDSSTNAVGPETEAFQEFIICEQTLVSSWLESRNLAVELNEDALMQIDNLCFDYYGIRLTGEII